MNFLGLTYRHFISKFKRPSCTDDRNVCGLSEYAKDKNIYLLEGRDVVDVRYMNVSVVTNLPTSIIDTGTIYMLPTMKDSVVRLTYDESSTHDYQMSENFYGFIPLTWESSVCANLCTWVDGVNSFSTLYDTETSFTWLQFPNYIRTETDIVTDHYAYWRMVRLMYDSTVTSISSLNNTYRLITMLMNGEVIFTDISAASASTASTTTT